MASSPAQIIASKFPTQLCILRFRSTVADLNEVRTSPHWTTAFVLSVLPRTVERKQPDGSVKLGGTIEAFVVIPERGNDVKKLVRNLDNEASGQVHDAFTYNMLKESEIILLPSQEHVREVVRGEVNAIKDGLVDRSVEATQAVGEVRAALDALKVRVDSLPVAGDYRQMEKDFAAIKLLAGNVEERLANALKAAEALQAQRESRQQAQFDAQASRMAALEQQVKAQAALLNGLVQTLEANTAPAPETEQPAQATPATPAQAPTQSDPVAVYSAKLSGMSVVTQLYAEYGRLGLPKPKTGTSMAEMRTQLAKAFAERQTQA